MGKWPDYYQPHLATQFAPIPTWREVWRKSFARWTARTVGVLALIGLTACNPVTIPNPFGGAPLVLTGNLGTDQASIAAYSSALKAGVKADATKLQAFFVASCPYVAAAQTQLPAAQAAAVQVGMTATAAQKQIANAATALSAAATVCAAATTPSVSTLQAVFTAAVDAFQLIYGLVKNGN